MADDRKPWERNNNPEPWTRPDKPAPWLNKSKQKDIDPWDRPVDPDPWDRPTDPDPWESSSRTRAVSGLRGAENNAASGKEPRFYTGKGGKGKDNSERPKAKGIKSKIAVIGVIASFIIGGGAFLASSNSLLAGALEALFTSATDTQYTSYSLRVPQIMKHMLQGGNQTTVTWYGAKKYTHMPASFQKRLSQFGIEVEGSGTNRVLKWNDETISADQFINKYHTDVEFRDAYSSAKRGRVATFFDNVADKIYQKLGLSRNLFSKYRQTGDSDADMTSFRDTMSPEFEGNTTSLTTGGNKEETITKTDSDGNPIIGQDGNVETETIIVSDTDTGTSSTQTGTNVASAETKASSFVSSLASKAATATQVLDATCAILKVGNLISMAVAANEMYQSINYFMGLMENISKMKAGEGDASAINEVLNFFSKSQDTEIPNLSKLPSSVGLNAEVNVESKNVSGSMLEANGVQMILANAPANASTTQNYSLDRTTSAFMRVLGFNTATATACSLTQIAESAISMAVTIGTGGIAKIVGGFFVTAVVNTALAFAINAAVGFLVPVIAKSLFTNVFDTVTGIPAGELFARGGSAANTRVGRSGSGQSPSSPAKATQFNHATNVVLAMDAEIDRKNLSPFDITNRNTFFGSIAYSLLPVISSTKTTSITSLVRTTSTSLASLMGRVSAEGEGSSYMTSFGNCPSLDEIGAAGDIYCNPITTTDLSTIDISPDDPTYGDVLMGSGKGSSIDNLSCDSDGNCTINDDSNLARYITYCDGRDSPFGVLDSGILSNFETSSGAGAFGTLLNSIPIVGDVISIIDGLDTLDPVNQGWATGANCVNSSSNDMWDSEMKYYQRYVEDQRILEQMGAYEDSQNPVLAYEEKYAAEHPLDMSEAGILAHYSGMSKDDAEVVIAVLDIYQFIDEYDASSRIALKGNTTSPKTSGNTIAEWEQGRYHEVQKETVNDPLKSEAIAKQRIVYFDVRNRSYAV